MSIINFVYYQY